MLWDDLCEAVSTCMLQLLHSSFRALSNSKEDKVVKLSLYPWFGLLDFNFDQLKYS